MSNHIILEKACRNFGDDWKVDKTTDRALVCTKGTVTWGLNCNSCSDWRLLVWENGGFELDRFDLDYRYMDDPSTIANKYYGGHNPCATGDNYQLCGDWMSELSGNL